MAFKFGGKIITDGLALYLDAANSRSYPSGSVSTWYDLTPNIKNATLTNAPTYTSSYNGGLVFSTASLQYFTIEPIVVTTESFAIDIWFKAGKNATVDGYAPLLSCTDFWSGASQQIPGWGIGYDASSTNLYWGTVVKTSPFGVLESNRVGGPTLTTGSIYNITLVRNRGTELQSLYVNGVLHSSASLSNTASISSSYSIGRSTWQSGTVSTNHTYYLIKMNVGTNFSQTEITQNYNTLKPRFGL